MLWWLLKPRGYQHLITNMCTCKFYESFFLVKDIGLSFYERKIDSPCYRAYKGFDLFRPFIIQRVKNRVQ